MEMTNEAMCREAFEKWYDGVNKCTTNWQDVRKGDGYIYTYLNDDWIAYKAAWSARENEVQVLKDALIKCRYHAADVNRYNPEVQRVVNEALTADKWGE